MRALRYKTVVPDACWWCGAAADSREHKMKRSDIAREYGKPPYAGPRTLTRFSANGQQDFQGPQQRRHEVRRVALRQLQPTRAVNRSTAQGTRSRTSSPRATRRFSRVGRSTCEHSRRRPRTHSRMGTCPFRESTALSAQPPVVIRPAADSPLTPQQAEVLAAIANGATTAQIAAALWISPVSVRTRLHNARLRLGTQTQTHAVALALALANGWLEVVE